MAGTNPIEMSDAMKQGSRIVELYSDYAASHLSTMYVPDDAEYKRMSRKYAWSYLKLMPPSREAAILDVGCGVGHFLSMLENSGYTNCSGVDASRDAIDVCMSKVRSRVHLSDASSYLRAHPSSADCIVSMHVLEHMELGDGIEFVKLLFGSLRPQGVLILATPNGDSPWAGHCMYDDMTHKRLYTPRTLRELLLKGGFDTITLQGEMAIPYDMLTRARWMLAGLLHIFRKIVFMIEIGPGRRMKSDIILTPGLIAVAKKQTPAINI